MRGTSWDIPVIKVEKPGIGASVMAAAEKDPIREKDQVPEDPPEEVDPYALQEDVEIGTPWNELDTKSKVLRVLGIILRVCIVFGLLYLFICSLSLLGSAFQLVGGRAAGDALTRRGLLDNPIAGMMVGVVVTVVLQSSSTSTSITVTLVASGLITLRQGIPIIMGANVGTSVTCVLVSLTQSGDRNQFRRAFAGATVHDMFNWLCVIVLLPVEAIGHFLEHLTEVMTRNLAFQAGQKPPEMLRALTRPFTRLLIRVDSQVIEAVAAKSDLQKRTMIQYWCKENTYQVVRTFTDLEEANRLAAAARGTTRKFYWAFNVNQTFSLENGLNVSTVSYIDVNQNTSQTCSFLFHGQGMPWSRLSELASGLLLLGLSLFILVVALICMVKVLHSLLQGPLASAIKKMINAEFPGIFACLTGYVAILVGAGMTVIVQSSSVFTSTLTPLVGMGVVAIERTYPLTLGSNIGTTVTGIMAALVQPGARFRPALRLALCHLFFNIIGILMLYPVPIMRRIPIRLAKFLGNRTAKFRWFAVFYVILMFLCLPLTVFALSLAGLPYLIAVICLAIVFVIFITIVNVLQKRKPEKLPERLRDWDNIPPFTLAFYDRGITAVRTKGCSCCPCKKNSAETENSAVTENTQVPAESERISTIPIKEDYANPAFTGSNGALRYHISAV